MTRITIAAALSALLCGCAGEMAMRDTARESAAVLNQYRSGLSNFASEQSKLNSETLAGIQHLRDLRDERRAEIASRLTAWRLAGRKPALDEFAMLTERNADAIIASNKMLSPAPAPAAPAVSFDAGAVNSVIKQLLLLEKPQSLADRAKTFLQFTDGVRTAMDEDVDEAATATKEAVTETRQDGDAAEAVSAKPPQAL